MNFRKIGTKMVVTIIPVIIVAMLVLSIVGVESAECG